jgi:Uma2 family endonuclease
MSVAIDAPLMTTEQLLAMPRNGTERWLIRGQLREKPITVRNRTHSRLMANVVYVLKRWLETQTEPHGQILCGEAGCRLRRNPDSTVGIDVAYVAASLVQQQTDETTLIEGVPVLAVEILSPSDTEEELNEKIDDYLAAGVALVWIVDPHDQTVTIYRAKTEPALVTMRQELSGEPHLSSFRVPAAEIFA